MRKLAVGATLCALGVLGRMPAGAQPPDVRSDHWAAHAVDEALANRVMSLDTDQRFHGEAKVTRAQAAVALERLARTLETNQWHAVKSSPVPASAVTTLQHGDWKKRPVTRYVLASLLARFGDYVTNGVTRAPAGSTDTNRSEIMPPAPKVSAAAGPAHEALVYLAGRREVTPDSPLLKDTSQTLTGSELSRALAEMIVGLNNHITSLGMDANGDTPDATFHKKSPSKPQ